MKKLSIALMLCLSGLFSSTLYAAGYGGGSGIDESPYQISSVADWQELMATPDDWGSYFVLTADINLQGITVTPVGNNEKKFTGNFNGDGHTLSNVRIDQPTGEFVGLFGYVGGRIENLGVVNTHIEGSSYVGGLVGENTGTIVSCYITGTVSGSDNVGGLVGGNGYPAYLSQCYSSGSVSGSSRVGGLCGANSATISGCYAVGPVNGGDGSYDLGGLCGENSCTFTIINCYATGAVTGGNSSYNLGGFCGLNENGTIINCYSTRTVTGGSFSYNLGGFCGYQSESYSEMSNSFWDTDTSAMTVGYNLDSLLPGTVTNVLGKTTVEMQTLSTFTDAGWDFSAGDGDAADWQMPADSYPRLAWEKIITFSPDGGSYLSKQNVTITCSSPTATIHYTVNGNTPTESDPVIASGSSVLISKSMTLKARAWEEGSNPSEIKSANYQINLICPTADLNGDCKVDLEDFAILARWWLDSCNPLNQWCAGTDLDLSGVIDLGELEDVVEETLEGESIADHVKYITVDMEWDYLENDNPNVNYNFRVNVDTDESVALVSFTTPTGRTIVIPAMDKVWNIPEPNGLLSLGMESYTPGECNWEYLYNFYTPGPLSSYGDGLYTFTIYYTDGGTQQTTVWFGIPGTTDPLPQPTQEPVFTSIHYGGTFSSPVTFAWEACTDPADHIFFMTISSQTYLPGNFYTLSPQAIGLYTPIELTSGEYTVFLTFISGDDGWGLINDDGIPYSAYKSSGNWGCVITVE